MDTCPSHVITYCDVMQVSGGEPVFTKMSGNMTLGFGSSVILECAVSEPQADVMWLVNS